MKSPMVDSFELGLLHKIKGLLLLNMFCVPLNNVALSLCITQTNIQSTLSIQPWRWLIWLSSKWSASKMCSTKHKPATMSVAAGAEENATMHIKSAWWFAASLQRLQQPFHFQGEGVLNRSMTADKLWKFYKWEITMCTWHHHLFYFT